MSISNDLFETAVTMSTKDPYSGFAMSDIENYFNSAVTMLTKDPSRVDVHALVRGINAIESPHSPGQAGAVVTTFFHPQARVNMIHSLIEAGLSRGLVTSEHLAKVRTAYDLSAFTEAQREILTVEEKRMKHELTLNLEGNLLYMANAGSVGKRLEAALESAEQWEGVTEEMIDCARYGTTLRLVLHHAEQKETASSRTQDAFTRCLADNSTADVVKESLLEVRGISNSACWTFLNSLLRSDCKVDTTEILDGNLFDDPAVRETIPVWILERAKVLEDEIDAANLQLTDRGDVVGWTPEDVGSRLGKDARPEVLNYVKHTLALHALKKGKDVQYSQQSVAATSKLLEDLRM